MKDLAYQQLTKHLETLTPFKSASTPAKGWIRAIRNGLGMSRRQLAARLGLSVSRIQRLEHDEVTGSVTMKSLQRTAEAMDCVLVYAVIPRTSLDETIERQAQKKALAHMQSISHSMALEKQALDSASNQAMLETLTQQLIQQSKHTLWDED